MIHLNMGAARGRGAAPDTILRAVEGGKRTSIHTSGGSVGHIISLRDNRRAGDDLMGVMFSLMVEGEGGVFIRYARRPDSGLVKIR